jgi:hypothetical protein
MRERALPYFIDSGVLMRQVWYHKAEIKVVVVSYVLQEYLLKLFHNNPHSSHF